MKKLIPLVLLLALLVGCGTTTGDIVVSGEGSVNSALVDWTVHVIIDDAPVVQQNKVKAAYEKYKSTKNTAQKLGANQAVYANASAAQRAAAKELVDLIRSYSPTK